MSDNLLLLELIKASSPTDSRDELKNAFSKLSFKSVFDITRLTEAQFIHTLGLGAETKVDARQVYDNAQCLAAQISHLYREQQLSSGKKQLLSHSQGIRAIEDEGPTYTNLFRENWDEFCKVGAVAAIDSPAAYLRALYRFAQQLETSATRSEVKPVTGTETTSDTSHRILLETRRPDLGALLIDQQSTFSQKPMLTIVNDILSTNIKNALKNTNDKDKSIHSLLAERRYPFILPYNIYHHQCLLGLSGDKPALGELNYLISKQLPITGKANNHYGQVQTPPHEAQRLLSGLSPEQQKLLLEPTLAAINFTPQYWKKTFGIETEPTSYNLKFFMERTGLKAEHIEPLLAQGSQAPRRSPNYRPGNAKSNENAKPNEYGARYINGPASYRYETKPENHVTLEKDNRGNEQKVTCITLLQLDNLQRMIRLQRWLDIPFTELDTLISSAIDSEGDLNPNKKISVSTLRALGVFRDLNRRYAIKPEEFGALLHELSPYSTGDRVSLFDQVFNSTQVSDTALVLDEQSFTVPPPDTASKKTLQRLSASLGVPLTEDALLGVLKHTQEVLGTPLKRDLHTLSSVYRQTRIARMFGLSVADSWAMAKLLGADDFCRTLVNGTLKRDLLSIRMTAQGTERRLTLNLHVDRHAPTTLLEGSTLEYEGKPFTHNDSVFYLTIRHSKHSIRVNYSLSPITPGQTLSLKGMVLGGSSIESLTDWHIYPWKLELREYKGERHVDIWQFTIDHKQPVSGTDILTVLTQMDWAVSWLATSNFDFPKLLRLLTPVPTEGHSLLGFQQRLDTFRVQTKNRVLSEPRIATLMLPKTEIKETTDNNTSTKTVIKPSINWHDKLLEEKLIDSRGLVNNLVRSVSDDVAALLDENLLKLINPLSLDLDPDKNKELKDDCKNKLKDLLMEVHDRQLHLVEELLQETSQLPMNCTRAVLLWAGLSPHKILESALDTEHPTRLAALLEPAMRHAEASITLHLSNSALQVFLQNPLWLDNTELSHSTLSLTLRSLYLLDRFNHLLSNFQRPEEALLGYLRFANKSSSSETEINNALTQLLGWTASEVSALTATLTPKYAHTMQHVDWIMRCHATCKSTGLTADALLKATALTTAHSADDWRMVGEAVIAASH
ncbi:Tc toxin subunit A [Pseudomonas brassicacearum]|uniref:Toxin n=1 Tax=Pseudomonas brassicacearum TaxID=930166 RepID=A0A423JRI0_9PSED|nr:Tc toxin subunit A [Pseudomonas brassicacearum]RON40315.1 hypothetical protein BK664_07060 [Pseudomonas brassicacearum]